MQKLNMKNRVTMEMTRNKQKATLYTLQRSNETWNQNHRRTRGKVKIERV